MTTPNFEQEADIICGKWLGFTHPYFPKMNKAIVKALRAAYEKGVDYAAHLNDKHCDTRAKYCYGLGFEACREAAARVVCKRCAEGRPLRGDCHQWNEHDWAMCLALSIRALTPTNTSETSTEGK